MAWWSLVDLATYTNTLSKVDETKDPEGELEEAPCVDLQSHSCHGDD